MGFFTQLKDSFTNFAAYRDIAAQKTSKTFKYFLLLFTVVFLIGGIRFAVDFKTGVTEVITSAKEKLPEFTLTDGKLSVQGQQPMVIKGDNQTVLVIDTTGKTDESVLDQYSEGVFISQDKLVNKQNNIKTETVYFSELKAFNLDKQKLLSYLPLLNWALAVIGIIIYFFKGAWVLVTTVILALLGLMFNSSLKGKLNFGNTWNIAVYAFTLPWLIEMVKNLAYPGMPYFGYLKWAIAGFIMYKGVEAAVKLPPGDELPEPPGNMVI